MAKESGERRLWIGNLDPRITEFQLLKLVQKYGEIEKFDLLFHRNGPLAGQPRGYAFVTYVKKVDAEKAKEMHNKLLGARNIIVTWAHSIPTDEQEKPKNLEVNIPVLAISKNEKKADPVFQIQAIEAKLKLMQKQSSSKELEINKTVADERPLISQFQFNKQTATGNVKHKNNKLNRRPYEKSKNWR